MKIALVHDDLIQAGGAERVVVAFHDLFPEAPLYTSIYDRRSTLAEFAQMDVRTSFLQSWPIASRRWHKLALAQYPTAFEQFDLNGYDLVLSSASRFAKAVITPPETCHICYCHAPTRALWRQHEYLAQGKLSFLLAPLLRKTLHDLRSSDWESAQRVDYFIANSLNIARRIRKYYRRDAAAIIYPPIEVAKYCPVGSEDIGDHFLIVSRLVGYKRIDLAIEACNRLEVPLRIVGAGPELAALQRKAGPFTQFLGRLPDAQVAAEYASCRALIFPGEEDLGMTPLECMASGRPVVAYGAGGALETVIEGKTGVFFREQTVDALAAALKKLHENRFVPEALQAHARQFDISIFQERMRQFLQMAVAEHKRTYELGAHDKNISYFCPPHLSSDMAFHFTRHAQSDFDL